MSKADRGGESHGGGVPNTPRVAKGGKEEEISGNSGELAGRKINDGSLSLSL